jgi:hypothetical protein
MNDAGGSGGKIARYTRDDRRFAAAAGVGFLAAFTGFAWIITTFTRRPWFDAAYHVPVAGLVVGSAVDAWLGRRDRPVRGYLLGLLLALAYTLGRVIHDWPCSGHGVLGVAAALAATRPFWRRFGVLVAVQAFAFKAYADERPLAAVYGAALGAVIGFVALRIDRGSRNSTARA